MRKSDVVLWFKHVESDEPLRRVLNALKPGDVCTLKLDGNLTKWERIKSQPNGALSQGFKPADALSKAHWGRIASGERFNIAVVLGDEKIQPPVVQSQSSPTNSVLNTVTQTANSRRTGSNSIPTGTVVWAVDIGSIKQNRLGWCRMDSTSLTSGHDIRELVSKAAEDLGTSKSIAIGFECPLFVPVPENPIDLTSARRGEGSKPWSAGAGSGALATGLTESVWILDHIRMACPSTIIPTFDWKAFSRGEANLFLWEAFVTGTAKGSDHLNDAEIAALSFVANLPDIVSANSVTAENPYSLIGAAILRARLSTDLSLLFEPCVVVRS